MNTPPSGLSVPAREELSELSARLQREYQLRFDSASRDLAIGSTSSSRSRGIGIEIDRNWYTFSVAKRRFRKGWTVTQGMRELETTLREFLERQLT